MSLKALSLDVSDVLSVSLLPSLTEITVSCGKIWHQPNSCHVAMYSLLHFSCEVEGRVKRKREGYMRESDSEITEN